LLNLCEGNTSHFCTGKGLPATLEDIVVIERALTRRMFDMNAHDIDEVGGFERRIRLMEDLEAQQWADRERELNLIMEYKMKLVNKALSDLRNDALNLITTKMEKALEESQKNAAYELARIRHNYLRGKKCILCARNLKCETFTFNLGIL
jgi:hypothetical protein